jgi:predicted HAD superfamily Cof-like phosphohydrolase
LRDYHMRGSYEEMGDATRDALEWAVQTCERASGDNAYVRRLKELVGRPDLVRDVRDFSAKFGLRVPNRPRFLFETEEHSQVDHLSEELDEYARAANLADRLDALVDLVYVALGTALLHGFNFEEAWRRVHAANMRKERSAGAGAEHDVVKPPGWVAPDLSDLVAPHGYAADGYAANEQAGPGAVDYARNGRNKA